MRSAIKNNIWASVLAFLAIGLSLYLGIQYFVFGANSAGLVTDKLGKMTLDNLWYVMIYVHIATSIAAICTGWLQFVTKFRVKSYRRHKTIGRIYSVGVFIGGLTGVYLSFYATGGLVSTVGFLLLSLLWLYTMVQGLRAIIVRKDKAEHQRWMTRNYALTFAAVTLRIYLPLSMLLFGLESFDDYYRVISWLCWVPNLLFAQWLISRRAR